MPRFLTISPTHIPGRKEHAWNKCRDGGYVAIGWMHVDLSGKSWTEVEALIRSHRFPNEASALDSFRKLMDLRAGDYVAVNNTNHGLFGIGVVTSPYRFEDRRHDTGSPDRDRWYSHLVGVEWRRTSYVRRRDLLREGETGWAPYGTVGALLEEVPAYILRALGPEAPQTDSRTPERAPANVRPAWLEIVIGRIASLRSDPNHQERAHESLVEDFLDVIGYRKHEDIKYRQGRIDITVADGGKPILLFEVKRDWDLDHTRIDVVRQAYSYALEKGIRYVAITNGDYYSIRDRLKGLSYESNVICEFTLSALQDEDLPLIESLKRGRLGAQDVRSVLKTISECF